MTEKVKSILDRASKFRYPIIILAVGILLMLLPSGKAGQRAAETGASDEEARMEYVLSSVQGAGSVNVLLSENGAVIVCSGADNAQVKLGIIDAASAYTGFTSDRITVLRIDNNSIGEAKK